MVIYKVHTEGKSNEGLLFSVDDAFAENFQDGVHYRINKGKRRNKKTSDDGGRVLNVLQHPSKQANGSAGENGV